jgi:uncharacterized protein YciI
MSKLAVFVIAVTALGVAASPMQAQTPPAAGQSGGSYDETLARSVGADDYGMRNYVLVILKTGPTKVPAGAERVEMFRGHMANIARLSKEGKMALAGPFAGEDSWRGLFILAVSEIEEAKRLVATDPVVVKGEMIAEYHKFYGSAALMLVPGASEKIAKKSF